ncbi:S16 family serine protease [Actinoplanes subtropicus]|uniref:S16 family serine protease n=1 Tax=Actinoplanes subtropicus TaxID=543632 RepID=UPI0004C2E70E|nr:S16 family serine protease [Actinoplanes subtropicus]
MTTVRPVESGRPRERAALAHLDKALAGLAGFDLALGTATPEELYTQLVTGLWWEACAEASESDPARVRRWSDGLDERLEAVLTDHASLASRPQDVIEAARAVASVAVLAIPAGGVVTDDDRARARRTIAARWSAAGVLRPEPSGPAGTAGTAFADLAASLMAGSAHPGGRHSGIRLLFDNTSADRTGRTGSLEVRRLPGGPPGLFPDPATMGFVYADTAFQRSIAEAWAYATRGTAAPPCVLWSVSQEGDRATPIMGSSLGAAFAVALCEVVERRWVYGLRPIRLLGAFRTECAVTGAVTTRGRILKVGGLTGKLEAADRRGWRVLAPADNFPRGRDADRNVVPVATVRQARQRVRRWVPRRVAAAAAAAVLVAGIAVTAQLLNSATQQRDAQERMNVAQQLLARSNEIREDDPTTAIRLSLAAADIENTAQTRSALIDQLTAGHAAVTRGTGDSAVYAVSDGAGTTAMTAMTANDRGAALWDLHDPYRPAQVADLWTYDRNRTIPGDPATGATIGNYGKTVLVAAPGEDGGAVKIWDTTVPTQPRMTLAWRPCISPELVTMTRFAAIALVVCADGTIALWNVEDRAGPKPLGALAHGVRGVHAVALDYTGGAALVAADGGAALYRLTYTPRLDPASRTPVWRTHVPAYAAALTSDGWTALVGEANGVARLERPRAESGVEFPLRIDGRTGTSRAVAVLADGKTVIVGGDDNSAVIWRWSGIRRDYAPAAMLTHLPDVVTSVALTEDGATAIVGGADGGLRFWPIGDPPRYSRMADLTGFTGPVSQVGAPGTGGLAATVADGAAELWDLTDPGRPRRVGGLHPDHGDIIQVALRADPALAVTADTGGVVTGWDLSRPAAPRKVWAQASSSPVRTFDLSADGRLLAAGAQDGRVTLFDLSDPTQWREVTAFSVGHQAATRIALDRFGKFVAIGTEGGAAAIWSLADPRHPRPAGSLPAADGRPVALAVNPRSTVLVRAGERDPAPGQYELDGTATPKPVRTLTEHVGPVTAVAYNEDGTMLAVASQDSTVDIWSIADPYNPSLISVLTGHTAPVLSVAFGGDGGTVLTGGADRLGILWDVSALSAITADPRRAACDRVGRALSPDDWAHDPTRVLPYVDGCA